MLISKVNYKLLAIPILLLIPLATAFLSREQAAKEELVITFVRYPFT
jgi:hypothetical protein